MRVFDSSSFRMVLCFFDRFYVTVDDMHVLEFDSPQAYMEHMRVSLYDAVLFPPVVEGQETNPWRTLSRSDDIGSVWLCDFSPVDEGVDPGSEHCDLRRVGGEQLFDGFVAFDVCL